jgi:hypothetical protein
MDVVAKLRRDLTRHRGKAAVLGILFATMIGMSARAFLELRPHAAAANVPTADASKPLSSASDSGVDADQRMRESQELWKRLKEVKATASNAQSAFAFDAAYYPPPLVTEVRPVILPAVSETRPALTVITDDTTAKANRIREQARGLVVKSTVVGDGSMAPMAIINQQLVTVGQQIQGFEVSAIRAREVVFVKEGVTTVVRMPDGQ